MRCEVHRICDISTTLVRHVHRICDISTTLVRIGEVRMPSACSSFGSYGRTMRMSKTRCCEEKER